MSNTIYRQILHNAITASGTKIEANKTTIVVWKDEAHMKKWVVGSINSDDVRIFTVDSETFPTLKPQGNNNPDEVGIVALGFSTNENYDDLRVIFHLTVKPN